MKIQYFKYTVSDNQQYIERIADVFFIGHPGQDVCAAAYYRDEGTAKQKLDQCAEFIYQVVAGQLFAEIIERLDFKFYTYTDDQYHREEDEGGEQEALRADHLIRILKSCEYAFFLHFFTEDAEEDERDCPDDGQQVSACKFADGAVVPVAQLICQRPDKYRRDADHQQRKKIVYASVEEAIF